MAGEVHEVEVEEGEASGVGEAGVEVEVSRRLKGHQSLHRMSFIKCSATGIATEATRWAFSSSARQILRECGVNLHEYGGKCFIMEGILIK